jgi:fructose-1,6-bisphosphatase I
MASQHNSRLITLEEFIIQGQNRFRGATGELSQLLRDIGLASKIISREVNKAGITNILGLAGSKNVQGEAVKKLDVFSNEQMIHAFSRSKIVCMVISEENEDIIRMQSSSGKYVVYMDPLDGSSNIDVNVAIGTIFGIYMRTSDPEDYPVDEDALQPGLQQVAAGYVLYGSSTIMVYTTGIGVNGFTLDPSIGEFFLSHPDIKIPEFGSIYSVNEGNYNGWSPGLKKYIEYCKENDKKTNRPFTSRYIGSMVADVHRTLLKGGIFIYPESKSKPDGKLRLMYECNPMAFIVEQAGGMAVDRNGDRLLEREVNQIHQRCEIYLGSRDNVRMCADYIKKYRREPHRIVSEDEAVEVTEGYQ